jgi:hypothetical protein
VEALEGAALPIGATESADEPPTTGPAAEAKKEDAKPDKETARAAAYAWKVLRDESLMKPREEHVTCQRKLRGI